MTSTQHPSSAIVRDAIARGVAVVGLAGMALIHLLDAPGTFQSRPYMGWMYVGLMIGALALAGALVRASDSRVWAAAAALALTVMVGYTLSRTTGLPQDSDDIGNWSEPLGLASLFVEGGVAALAASVLAGRTAFRAAPALARVRRPDRAIAR